MRRKWSTVTFLVFSITLVLYLALPSQALNTQGKNKNAKGQQLYMTYCASCHGIDGKGGGPAAPALKVTLPDLTKLAQQEGKLSEVRILRVINGDDFIAGHGSREMPVWGDYFRKTRDNSVARLNVYALTKYIASIQAK